jgi:hypothetical protein
MSLSIPSSGETETATSAVYITSSETAFRAALVNRNTCKGMESSVKNFRGDMGLSGNDLRVQPDLAQNFCALVEVPGNARELELELIQTHMIQKKKMRKCVKRRARVDEIVPGHPVVEVTSRPPFENVRYFAHAVNSLKSLMVVSQIAQAGVLLQQRFFETFATFIAPNQDVPSVSSLTGGSSDNKALL